MSLVRVRIPERQSRNAAKGIELVSSTSPGTASTVRPDFSDWADFLVYRN